MEQMRQGIYVYVMYEKIQTLVSFNFFKRAKKKGGLLLRFALVSHLKVFIRSCTKSYREHFRKKALFPTTSPFSTKLNQALQTYLKLIKYQDVSSSSWSKYGTMWRKREVTLSLEWFRLVVARQCIYFHFEKTMDKLQMEKEMAKFVINFFFLSSLSFCCCCCCCLVCFFRFCLLNRFNN